MLPAAPTVSERDGRILGACKSYTSAYRKEWFARNKVTDTELDALVSAGYLKKNKAGAISITTSGKNVATKGYLY
jgi:hypothetical protein